MTDQPSAPHPDTSPGWARWTRPLPPLVVAGVVLLRGHSTWAVALFAVAGAVVVAGIVSPRQMARFDQLVSAVTRRLLDAVLKGAFVVLWCLFVLPSWSITRIRRRDPLRPSRPGWQDRTDHADRPMSHVTAPPWGRIGLAGVALVGIVVASLLLVTRPAGVEEPPDLPADGIVPPGFGELQWPSEAHRDGPWADELLRSSSVDRPFEYDPYLGFRPLDHRSRYVNVADGVRRSYVPDEPQLTIWFFGGSTMFGLGQRDLHTIPSEVARLAERDGIRLEPVNLGVSGYVAWQEAIAFQQRLMHSPPPDLAVFYNGVNDIALQSQRSREGDPDLERPSVVSGRRFAAALRSAGLLEDGFDPVERDEKSAEQAGIASTAVLWNQGRRAASWVAGANGIPVRFYWQPNLLTKQPIGADADALRVADLDAALAERAREEWGALVRDADPPAVDLSDALNGESRPVYLDFAHTNERGAAAVARAMYADLRPLLEELAASR